MVAPLMPATTATAATINSAAFSRTNTNDPNTAVVGGIVYARAGGGLTLTVNTTSNDTKCVAVTGAFTDRQTSTQAKGSWTFTTTSLSGNGTQTATITAGNNSPSNGCSSQTATSTATFVLDNTGPVVTSNVLSAPNAAGWYKDNVTVAWTCSDSGSGIATCPANSMISSEGTNLTASATATDKVSNSTTATSSPAVKIDKTGPTLTGAPTTSPNGTNGWYTSNVTIAWTCSDALSGINGACPANSMISGEGMGLTDNASVSDKAGNVTNAISSPAVKIDKTPPNTTANAPANWRNGDVTVNLTPVDGVSGVAATYYKLDGGAQQSGTSVVISTEGTHTLEFWSVDNAGNTESTKSVQVKIDKTMPTITASRMPAANAFGWNNSDVTVSFTCDDALSGIQSCSGSTTLSSGTGQNATGTAVDNAGNSASTTVSNINIDMVVPTLSGAPTTIANANGWYNSDVTIAWQCDDASSGINGDCPDNSTISSEGTGLTVNASVSDKAGNSVTATSNPAVKIDKTPPNTTASAPANWNNTNVTVNLNANDALSLVDATYYILDGGAQQSGTSVVISDEGTHALQFWSEDKAGNVEQTKTVQVKIDKTPPTINHTQDPMANSNGWNNTNVTVTFVCNDSGGSGVADCTNPQTVTTEGQNQSVPGTATDNAGNTANDPATVSIDKTPPLIAAMVPAANSNGWHKTDVTVSFECSDDLSGMVAGCGPNQTLGEGANQSAIGTATDAAGNMASTTATGINVDKTNPVLTGQATTLPNSNGWYNSDVVVSWTCSDALSGLDGVCPANNTVTGEGDNLSASASINDKAGNTTNTTVDGIKIDRTAPSTHVSVPALPASGWYADDVQVTLNTNPDLSGVDKTYYRVDGGAAQEYAGPFNHTLRGSHTISFWSVDKAGNVEDETAAGHSITLQIDGNNPIISGSRLPMPNSYGWNNAAVTVTFDCNDAESGIASCTDPTTLSNQGENQSVTGEAKDVAGNSVTQTVSNINIDLTPPTLSGTPTTWPNSKGWYKGDVVVQWTGGDDLSGIDPVTQPANSTVTGEGDNLNTGPVSIADKAGNITSTVVSGIKIDITAPNLSGAPATASDGNNGWYKSNVTIVWTCDDALSKIDGSCPANSIISAEGENLTANALVSDNAGNETSATSDPAVKIDKTAPSVSSSRTPANSKGWNNTGVTVSFTGDDNLSGVSGCTADVVKSEEGVGQSASGDCTDNAGNVSDPVTVSNINIDLTRPSANGSRLPLANSFGWNNTAVTVIFTGTDALSGIDKCTDDIVKSGEGENLSATGSCADNAGNASDEVTVSDINIDLTPPTLSGAPTMPANSKGWYKGDVVVQWNGSDGLSGINPATQPANSTITGEGDNLSAGPVSIEDKAGNSNSASVSGIKIDRTAPNLTGVLASLPNSNGWFKDDVAVNWLCSDALSDIDGACPSDSLISSQGVSLTVSAVVTDNAGNSASATSPEVNLDKTKPALAGAPTTQANDNGWYMGDVTIQWLCSDALSGIDGGCPANSTITGEGNNLSAGPVSVFDLAGNSSTASVNNIKIDRTAPKTTADVPAASAGGWYAGDVPVTLTTDPDLSGVDKTYYRVDGGTVQEYTAPFNHTLRGSHTITFWSVDKAGNVERANSLTLKIDGNAPSILGSRLPLANGYGWNNTSVVVSFVCDDAESSVANCTSPTTVSSEGEDQSVTGEAEDHAGNTLSTTVSNINIDLTKPTLSGAPTSSANGNGWYKNDVTIKWTCDDALSGIDGACPPNSTIAGEGSNLSATATVMDKAGNSRDAVVDGIKIDRTAPTLSGTPATSPDGNYGWYRSNVTISWTCDDALSGINGTCPANSTISTEGIAQTASASVSDKAGNSTTATSPAVKIDKTQPSAIPTQAPAAVNGWNKADVVVTWNWSDGGSGLDPVNCTQASQSNGEGEVTLTATCKDNAGNEGTATYTVKVDKTAPTVNCASPSSSWVAGNASIACTAGDNGSGMLTAGDASFNLVTNVPAGSEDNNASTNSRIVSDKAGNSSTAGPISGNKIDRKGPTGITFSGAMLNGGVYYFGSVPVAPTCTASDGGSGLQSCVVSGYNTGIGSWVLTATAKDNVGNTSNATLNYTVKGWTVKGYYQPVDMSASSATVWNTVKSGSAVPLKFELFAGSTELTSVSAVTSISQVKVACVAGTEDAVETIASTGSTVLRYDTTAGQFIFNWKTPSGAAGTCYKVTMLAQDGSSLSAYFKLK